MEKQPVEKKATKTAELAPLKSEAGVIHEMQSYISSTNLMLPPNYDAVNAAKSFWLQLVQTKDKNGNSALKVCTEESIRYVMHEILNKGLDPMKKQGYLIVYGTELSLNPGAFGRIREARAATSLREFNSSVIHEGDRIEIKKERGRTIILEHETSWANLSKPIIGAYATAVFDDGTTMSDIMTKADIDKSRAKSKTGGNVYKEFPEEMSKRTVESRLAKYLINTSDDASKMREELKAHNVEIISETDGEEIRDEDREYTTVEEIMNTPVSADVQPEDITELPPLPDEPIKPGKQQSMFDSDTTVAEPEEEWQAINYGTYKENKAAWITKPNSYNRETHTILARPKK